MYPDTRERPTLNQPAAADDAEDAVRHLIERLQAGLDHSDADRYDSMFAADLLWGSPYGAVLAGGQNTVIDDPPALPPPAQ